MAPDRSAESRLLELVGDIQGLLDLDEFREGLVVALRRAVPSDWVSLNELGAEPGSVWTVVVPPVPDETHEGFGRLGYQNPLVQRAVTTQDGRAYRFSDVVTRQELHATELYQEVYRPIGLEHQMAFMLPHEPPRLLGVALSRKRRDYSDAERDFVNRARPFLIQGYRNAVEHSAVGRGGAEGALLAALREAGLTPREADVMRLVALGRSNADTAAALGLSVRTVHKHLENAFKKLGVHSRSEAAALAWERAS